MALLVPLLAWSGIARQEAEPGSAPAGKEDREDQAARRESMIETQLKARGIRDPAVLRAMATVPREEFVPQSLRARAYDDAPLPIGHEQTISQPFIVALMTALALPRAGGRVLDVGTGSGYQAAVLAEIADHVYSIEIVPELAEEAAARLHRLGYDNVTVRQGDGWIGWAEHAPFDAIVVAAAPTEVPQPLVDQLAPGGRLVIPVGGSFQDLMVVTRHEDGTVSRESAAPVRFVPMTGIAQQPDPNERR